MAVGWRGEVTTIVIVLIDAFWRVQERIKIVKLEKQKKNITIEFIYQGALKKKKSAKCGQNFGEKWNNAQSLHSSLSRCSKPLKQCLTESPPFSLVWVREFTWRYCGILNKGCQWDHQYDHHFYWEYQILFVRGSVFIPFNCLFLQQWMPGDTELSHSEIDCDLNMTYLQLSTHQVVTVEYD